ncbi:moz sas family protein [Neofusicoccum parvum]|uniref:histone acetyltransferase n=2 Tax=Neofusicoccum parvum TaxID=310453 RepID=R1GJ75_BOTPV|nr:putative histone acetyltransferase protein [Neofusicoccum parvum UCRNP2]GME34037.1 moz sas family protein [Neofusicoccum parvum]GME39879.1 moz sas family protein [Neofusicoccum parvum]
MGPETPSQLGASPNGAPSAIAGPVAASSSANTAAAAPATTMTVPTPTMATAPSAPLQQQQQQQQAQAQQRPGPMEPNVLNVVLGDLLVKPWYPSFYPEELVGRRVERLYVCQWCFKYSKELIPFLGHTKVCSLKDAAPPGMKIYAKDSYSIQEVDGEVHKLYSQNLSLFGKLFLDTKSVFYDVTTFLYYLLISTNPGTGARQVIGFFSKEKMSWDNNNLACILVFPPWQRQALSELGRRGYTAYWSATIARYILSVPMKRNVTLRDVSDATYILLEDIVATLKEMKVLEHRPNPNKKSNTAPEEVPVLNKAKVRRWALENGVALMPPVDALALTVEWTSRERRGEEGAGD